MMVEPVCGYAYDALDALVRAKNDACEVTFVRDVLGRVIEEHSTPLVPDLALNETEALLAADTGQVVEAPVLGDLSPVHITTRTRGGMLARIRSESMEV